MATAPKYDVSIDRRYWVEDSIARAWPPGQDVFTGENNPKANYALDVNIDGQVMTFIPNSTIENGVYNPFKDSRVSGKSYTLPWFLDQNNQAKLNEVGKKIDLSNSDIGGYLKDKMGASTEGVLVPKGSIPFDSQIVNAPGKIEGIKNIQGQNVYVNEDTNNQGRTFFIDPAGTRRELLPGGGGGGGGLGGFFDDLFGGLSDIGSSVSDFVSDTYMDVRDPLQAAAVVAGNYFVPGSSLLTSQLVSDEAKGMLSSDVGQIANLAAGAAGAGAGNLSAGTQAGQAAGLTGQAASIGGNAALTAAATGDVDRALTSAAIGAGGGYVGSNVGSEYGQTAGQIAGGTTAGLLSGQDFNTALTNAAINTGANQAASGLMNAVNAPTATDASMTFTPSAPLNFGDTPVDYGQTGTGGLGLTATPAPLDMSNPYSFDTNYFSTGGLGLNATPAPFNPANPYSLDTNVGNRADMGGGTGIQVPQGEGATLGSIGAAAETPTQNPNLVNSVGTGLLSNYLKSLFTGSPSTGSTGTGNMATTQENNDALRSLFGGLLGGAGSLMQGETNNAARQTQANALTAAGQQAATASQFRPVGTTTTFGTSNFQVDPTTGQLISAGYNLSPQLQGYQNQLMAGGQQSLTDAANLQALGRGYIAQSPEAAAQQYMASQQALLAPSRDMESARLANQLQQTGRTGVAVAQGGSLGMANPEQQALANARVMQDLQLAAQAQQQGRAQTQFGQGLLTGAYDPFNAGIKTATGVEALGQQPLGMSTDLAKQFQQANATGAKYNLAAQDAATAALFPANQYNPYASLLSGAAGNNQLTSAAGKLFGNTAVGSSLAKYLGGLGGYDYSGLNAAASDFISQNPDIIPQSTFSGGGADMIDPELRALLGL
jgi:hypothetical protein